MTIFDQSTLDFLTSLKANNSRGWFQEHTADYEAGVKMPSKVFAAEFSAKLEKLVGQPQKSKVFRINRDLRFSKDKTPYNTHIHISWTSGSGVQPAFMFGLAPEYCTIGCGAFEFPKKSVDRYRRKLQQDFGDKLAAEIAALQKSGHRLSDPVLKRVPAGFDADHPNADLSRHKGLAVWYDFPQPDAVLSDDFADTCLTHFKKLKSFWGLLAGV